MAVAADREARQPLRFTAFFAGGKPTDADGHPVPDPFAAAHDLAGRRQTAATERLDAALAAAHAVLRGI